MECALYADYGSYATVSTHRARTKKFISCLEQTNKLLTFSSFSFDRLYVKARLVHGDLSEYNVMIVPVHLVENKATDPGSISDNETQDVQAVLIDFGQSADTRHPDAQELLERDIDRVGKFFCLQGVTTFEANEAIDYITKKYDGD
jgi:serine/threonine-protein kinase RIO1